GKERAGGEKEPEADRPERSQVQRQRGRARLRHQTQPRPAFSGRRRQGESQPALSRPRNGPPEPGTQGAGTVSDRSGRQRDRGIQAAHGRQYRARDPGTAEASGWRQETGKAAAATSSIRLPDTNAQLAIGN